MKELIGNVKWMLAIPSVCALVVLLGCDNTNDSAPSAAYREDALRKMAQEKIVVMHEDAESTDDEREVSNILSSYGDDEINDLSADEEEDMNDFYVSEIDDAIFARIKGKSYKDDCSVPVEELRYIHVLHIDFDGNTQEGELIVNVEIAEDILEVFMELYELSYPIEKIKLVDEYDADDEKSMADNNSSSFNYRTVSGTTKLSNHARGMAIDINPLYNPYIHGSSGQIVEPANAGEYVDRDRDFPHKIDKDDDAYKVFAAHGFSWGGDWKNSKDYQHFEK